MKSFVIEIFLQGNRMGTLKVRLGLIELNPELFFYVNHQKIRENFFQDSIESTKTNSKIRGDWQGIVFRSLQSFNCIEAWNEILKTRS